MSKQSKQPRFGVASLVVSFAIIGYAVGCESNRFGTSGNPALSQQLPSHTASDLDSLAGALQWRAEFDSAAHFFELAANQHLAENNAAGYVRALTNLGASQRDGGDYELGLRTIQSADSFAGRHGVVDVGLQAELTISYVRASRYAVAAESADTMLALVRKRSSYANWLPMAFHLVGWTRHEAGDFHEARSAYVAALDAQPAADSMSVLRAWILNNLGTLHRRFGHPAIADTFLWRSLEIREAVLPPRHPLIAASLANRGLVLLDLGRWRDAIHYYSRATDAFIERLGEEHPTVSKCYSNLGVMYREAGDLDSAWIYFTKGLNIGLKVYPPYHVDLYYKYLGLATLSDRFGDDLEALALVRKALIIAEKNFRSGSPELAWALERKGEILESIGEYGLAHSAYDSALVQLTRRKNGVSASTVTSLRIAARATSRNMSGVRGLREALSDDLNAIESELGPEHPTVLKAWVRAANGTARTGLYTYAASAFSRVVPHDTLSANHPELRLSAVVGLSDLLASQRPPGAADSLAALSKTALNLWNHIGDEQAYSSASSMAKTVHGNWLRVAHSSLSKREFAGIAYVASERAKGMKLRAQIARSRVAAGNDSTMQNLLTHERRLRRQLSPLMYSSRIAATSTAPAILGNSLHATLSSLKDVRRQISSRNAALYRARFSDHVSPVDSVKLAINDNEAVVSYFTGRTQIVISVIDKTQALATFLPRSADSTTAALREAIEKKDYEEYVAAARAAYKLLVEPIEHQIENKKLIVVPDGPLHSVPFELLLTEDVPDHTDERAYRTLPYLIRNNAISYSYSASLLADLRNRTRAPAPMDFLGIAPGFVQDRPPGAGPALSAYSYDASLNSDSTVKELRKIHLPGTLREVEDIRLLFEDGRSAWDRLTKRKTKTIVLDRATEATITSVDLSQYRIIHLATHAFADEKVPEKSALILTEDASPETDGLLQLNEVYNLTTNADLVVLSACETGLGRLAKGEGMIGLTRGFLYSGANSVVVSLWKADDWITRELMTLFYKGIVEGKSKSTALRDAKLQIIAKSPVHGLPYHWAHFVLIGE